MADTKISDEVEATTLSGAHLAGIQGGANKKFPPSVFAPERLPTLANNSTDGTNDIDISAGSAWDSTDTEKIICSAMTKQLDAGWAPGSAAGFRNSGAAIADTTYNVYAVSKALGADPDYYAHTSETIATVITALQAESGGASYTLARRIGKIFRASGAVVKFLQDGDLFTRETPVQDVSAANPGTSAVTRTLSVPLGTGILARVVGAIENRTTTAGVWGLLSSLDAADIAATSTLANIWAASASASQHRNGHTLDIRTNSSAQIRSRLSVSSTNDTLTIMTLGWLDRRGR